MYEANGLRLEKAMITAFPVFMIPKAFDQFSLEPGFVLLNESNSLSVSAQLNRLGINFYFNGKRNLPRLV